MAKLAPNAIGSTGREFRAPADPGVSWDPNPLGFRDGGNIILPRGSGALPGRSRFALIGKNYGSALALGRRAGAMVIFLRVGSVSHAKFSGALSSSAAGRAQGSAELRKVWMAEIWLKIVSSESLADSRPIIAVTSLCGVLSLDRNTAGTLMSTSSHRKLLETQLRITEDSVERDRDLFRFFPAA